jgi:subtilase family serine protease
MIRRISTSLLTIITLLSAATLVCHAQSLPLLTQHVREVTLNGQARLTGGLPAEQRMRLVIALPLRNQASLQSFLKDLYDPLSPSYHQFLTVEEFTTMFGPSQENYDAVLRFVEANGFTVVGTSRNRVNVDVTGTVSSIEKAFHVSMNVYQRPGETSTFYAPDREPTVDLPFQLWHISGLDNYSIPQPVNIRRPPGVPPPATTGSCPQQSFCGSDMRAAYYEGSSLNGAGQSVGLLEYYGTDLADLDTYFQNAGQTNNVPITLDGIDGTSTSCVYPSCDDTEQTLDMTQALGMAPGLSSLVMYIGSTDAAIFNAMATASPLNAQLSSSWTWSPADPNTDNPYFEEFATQGQNLFQAAGDSGKWSSSSEIFPADDVYITSVGGTDLTTSGAAGPWSSETAWADGGGGISPDKFTIPSWQTGAANECSSCSKTYRNGPDVSANANFTFYVCADQEACTANDYGGTSFAAPMWAGYLALVNQQAVENGKSTLGFINPTLYTTGLGSTYTSNFHDITSGSNGYSATTGYDLATGWGSPNGSGLITTLAGSGTASFTLSDSPSSVTITQGGAAGTSTITVNDLNGFNGSVTLAASGLPSGVTAVFNPTSTTTTSTLSLTASGTATTGTVTVTITGTSGGLMATTSLTLTVNSEASPNFTVGASPSSVTVSQGGNGTSTITVTSQNGFSSATTLSATGLPSGVTASFGTNPVTPPANGSATSVLTLSASSTATTGTSTITVSGTSGSLKNSTTISLTVNSSSGTQTAVYNSTLKAPECSTVASACDSGTSLLLSRDHISGQSESNEPNTINNSCADGTTGVFHSDESNDRIVVASTSGGPLTHATTATITAYVWAWTGLTGDALDLYYTANANVTGSPTWVFIKTITPTAPGANTLSTTYTLPTGSLQAVRAQFRYEGRASSCTTGSYNDHDDLIFAVQ